MALARFFELGVETEALTPVVAGRPLTPLGGAGDQAASWVSSQVVSPPSSRPSWGSSRSTSVFGSHVWGSSWVPRGSASPGAGPMEEVMELALLSPLVP